MRPTILVSAHTERESTEFADAAVSLSQRYADAIRAAGGLPFILPPTADTAVIRDAVERSDGVLLSGGEDVDPALYSAGLPPEVAGTVFPATGGRDLFEFILIDELFRQAKPMLAICRGQQIVNVALGGDLIADLPTQCPSTSGHNQPERRFEAVHEVEVEPDSLLARVTGTLRLSVNSTHHQAVNRVAPPLRVAGRSMDGVVEALELAPEIAGERPFFLSVQFHPERLHDRDPAHARLFTALVQASRRK